MKRVLLAKIIILVFPVIAGPLISGCGAREIKSIRLASSFQKKGDHEKAIALFSRVAVQPRLRNYAAGIIKNDFCLKYLDMDFRIKYHGLPDSSYAKTAESCHLFANRYPDLSDNGIIQYLSGLVFIQQKKYPEAIAALLDARKYGLLKVRSGETRSDAIARCQTTYNHLATAYAKLGKRDMFESLTDKSRTVCPNTGRLKKNR